MGVGEAGGFRDDPNFPNLTPMVLVKAREVNH